MSLSRVKSIDDVHGFGVHMAAADEVPCIVRMPLDGGHEPYLRWIAAETQGSLVGDGSCGVEEIF